MNKWVTLLTFEFPQDAQVAKLRLEADGIIVFLKDELTVQTDNFLSNAIGGVKLQVLEKDFEKAMATMIEGGFLPDPEEATPSAFWVFIDKLTKNSILKNLPHELRLIILVLLVILLVMIPVVVLTGAGR